MVKVDVCLQCFVYLLLINTLVREHCEGILDKYIILKPTVPMCEFIYLSLFLNCIPCYKIHYIFLHVFHCIWSRNNDFHIIVCLGSVKNQ